MHKQRSEVNHALPSTSKNHASIDYHDSRSSMTTGRTSTFRPIIISETQNVKESEEESERISNP